MWQIINRSSNTNNILQITIEIIEKDKKLINNKNTFPFFFFFKKKKK